MFLKTYNTWFDEIITTFAYENVNLILLINKLKWCDTLQNQEQESMLKSMDFCQFIKNKIADAISTSNDDNIEKQEPIEEIIIPLEKKRKNIKQIERSIIKWDTIKYLNY